MDEKEWSVHFYSREDGTSPVREFIERLDDKTQAQFIWSMEQLRQLMCAHVSRWSSMLRIKFGSLGALVMGISIVSSISFLWGEKSSFYTHFRKKLIKPLKKRLRLPGSG